MIKISIPIIFLFVLYADIQAYGKNNTPEDTTRWLLELPIWVPAFRGTVSFGDIIATKVPPYRMNLYTNCKPYENQEPIVRNRNVNHLCIHTIKL